MRRFYSLDLPVSDKHFLNRIFLSVLEAFRPAKDAERLVIRGRVLFPGGSRIPVETGGKLFVQLQDTSLADASSKVIAKYVGKAIRFPMAFAIKYTPDQVGDGVSYSLQVTIRSKTGELLYINDMHVPAIPLGTQRTKLIDVPVILVKSEGNWMSPRRELHLRFFRTGGT